jgi:hypothetical protein
MTDTPGDGRTPEDPGHGPDRYGPPYGGQPPGYPAPMQYPPDHPRSTMVLVLGILGLVACGIVAPFAWALGKRTLDEIDAARGMVGGRSAANAGYILGIVGTVILSLSLLLLVGMFVMFGLAAVSTFGY